MKALIKFLLTVAVTGLLWAGFLAWQNAKARRDLQRALESSSTIVSEEVLKNAERLAETLRQAKTSAKTNNHPTLNRK